MRAAEPKQLDDRCIANHAIDDLIGMRVAVRSNPTGSSDCEDVGVLESYDYPWVRLRKTKTEVICFPVYNIRLIKSLEPLPSKPVPPSEMLLRPVVVEESNLPLTAKK